MLTHTLCIDHVTQTKVRELTPDERIAKITGMQSGEKVTEAAVANARMLLSESGF